MAEFTIRTEFISGGEDTQAFSDAEQAITFYDQIIAHPDCQSCHVVNTDTGLTIRQFKPMNGAKVVH